MKILVPVKRVVDYNVKIRVAAKLDVMQISEITKVVSPDTFERPGYAGNAVLTMQSAEAKKVITVRTSAFKDAPEGGCASIETVAVPAPAGLSKFETAELTKSDRPELTSAQIVISGGRGMANGENFAKYIEPVAGRLGAATGSVASEAGRRGASPLVSRATASERHAQCRLARSPGPSPGSPWG